MYGFRVWLGRLFLKLRELVDKLSMLVGGLATLGLIVTLVASVVGLVGGPLKHSWWGVFSGQHQTAYTAAWQYAVLIFAAWLILHVFVRVVIGAMGIAILPRSYRQAVDEFGQRMDEIAWTGYEEGLRSELKGESGVRFAGLSEEDDLK